MAVVVGRTPVCPFVYNEVWNYCRPTVAAALDNLLFPYNDNNSYDKHQINIVSRSDDDYYYFSWFGSQWGSVKESPR